MLQRHGLCKRRKWHKHSKHQWNLRKRCWPLCNSGTCCHGPAEFLWLRKEYQHEVHDSPNCSLLRMVVFMFVSLHWSLFVPILPGNISRVQNKLQHQILHFQTSKFHTFGISFKLKQRFDSPLVHLKFESQQEQMKRGKIIILKDEFTKNAKIIWKRWKKLFSFWLTLN